MLISNTYSHILNKVRFKKKKNTNIFLKICFSTVRVCLWGRKCPLHYRMLSFPGSTHHVPVHSPSHCHRQHVSECSDTRLESCTLCCPSCQIILFRAIWFRFISGQVKAGNDLRFRFNKWQAQRNQRKICADKPPLLPVIPVPN